MGKECHCVEGVKNVSVSKAIASVFFVNWDFDINEGMSHSHSFAAIGNSNQSDISPSHKSRVSGKWQ